jgi:hypothetical protein
MIQALIGMPDSSMRNIALDAAFGLFKKYQCKQTLG